MLITVGKEEHDPAGNRKTFQEVFNDMFRLIRNYGIEAIHSELGDVRAGLFWLAAFTSSRTVNLGNGPGYVRLVRERDVQLPVKFLDGIVEIRIQSGTTYGFFGFATKINKEAEILTS